MWHVNWTELVQDKASCPVFLKKVMNFRIENTARYFLISCVRVNWLNG
jgi:hypothetical protein